MSSPFVAEIRMWGCNFPPVGWAFCDGQLLPISQNTALFSLIGTYYGGDGRSTFALPNLQGAAPMFWGQSTTGSVYNLGETGGTTAVTLLESEVPAHSHSLQAEPRPANLPDPNPNNSLGRAQPVIYKTSAANPPLQQLSPQAINPAGGSQPHNNLMPYLTLNFCIALQGIYPSRS